MKLDSFPFQTINWQDVPCEEHPGETGKAYWQVRHMNEVRIRRVEYTAGYVADHWCSKGHVLLCIAGELETELQDGRRFTLTPGMVYLVGDQCEAHRSATQGGCTLFIVD